MACSMVSLRLRKFAGNRRKPEHRKGSNFGLKIATTLILRTFLTSWTMNHNVVIEELLLWVSTRFPLDEWGRFYVIGLRGCHYAIQYLRQSYHEAVSLAPILFVVLVNKF